VIQRLRLSLVECYKYREVFYNILSQDLKVKYKRTALGYVWSLLNPVLQLLVLSVVFSQLVKWKVRDYTLFLFSGLLAWTFFQSTLLSAANSFLENENFIKKVHLPKALFPLSKLGLRAVDFLFSLAALSVIGAFIGFSLKLSLLLVPVAILILFAFTLGLAILFAVLTVYFRDVQYLLSVFLSLLYFVTPIMYPLSSLPPRYHFVLTLNPLFAQINLFQKLIYEGQIPGPAEWGVALGTALISLAVGLVVLTALDEDLVFRM
jgi:ABC-type polysaccharide/polyol phosphate export permease